MTQPEAGDDYITMPAELLVVVGEALHGKLWQSALANDLKHNSPRTVQRWAEAARARETYRVRRRMVEELLGLLEQRARTVPEAFDRLRQVYEAG